MKKVVLFFAGFFFSTLMCAAAFGAEVETLVDKLVEKKVLTPAEANEVLREEKTASENLPDWVKKVKFKGDLRLRYQDEKQDVISSGTTAASERQRGRIRFRLGAQAQVDDDWKVDFGLATGSEDPRSTNQTMQDNFSTKGINLDYAYLKYSGFSNIDLLGGKISLKECLWLNSDLLWDSDIAPEGAAFNGELEAAEGVGLFLNTAYFVLDEMSSGADPSMSVIQPGVKWEISESLKFKASFNQYYANSVKGLQYSNILDGASTNTTSTSPASFQYDYDARGFSAELGIDLQKDKDTDELINEIKLVADYIENPDPSEEGSGFLYGIKFGDKKVKEKGSWQVKGLCRRLEKDAWLDFLPDSDFLGGSTDAKGYELVLEYGLAKNILLGLDYYRTQTIKASAKKEQDLIQLDMVVKF